MARTQKWTPKRVRNEEDRRTGSAGFIDLSEGENFLAYALFDGDPAKDEQGYYEFLQHWVPSGKGGSSVPCAVEDCPLCEDGDKPRSVAYTAWLVLKDEKGSELNNGDGEVRSFRANSLIIKQITEMRGEDESPIGVQFRVSRLDDRGNYLLAAKQKKPMTKTAVRETLKASNIDYDTMVTNRLNKAMEGLAVARAVNAMDDDDDAPAPAKGKASTNSKRKPAQDEWPAEADDLEVVVDDIDPDGNFVMVTHDEYDGPAKVWTTGDISFALEDLGEGQVIEISYETDPDSDFVLNAEPLIAEEPEEDEEAVASDELPDELEDAEFEVVSIDKTNSTMEVKSDELDLAFTLYFLDRGPASEVDFDDYETGSVIVLSAEKDTVGDMVATKVPPLKEDVAPAKTPAKGRKPAAAATTTRKRTPAVAGAKGKGK